MSINEGLSNTVLADSGPASSSSPGASENNGANQSVPPAPMPRDKRGWHVVPAPDGRGAPEQDKPRPPHRWRGFWIFVGLLLALNFFSMLLAQPAGQPRVTVPFSPYFLSQVQAGQVKSISSTGDTITGTFATKLRYPADDKTATATTLFSTQVPSFWDSADLTSLLRSEGVQVNAQSTNTSPSVLGELLLGFGPAILLVGLFWFLARRASSGGSVKGALGNFGRSQARRVDPQKIKVTFDDVAGIDEAKGELTEIVDFLREPGRYTRLGGRMPHGVLLFGPPGTGKTLLARAVAGEAQAAFFSLSASEFIEAIVGVGAAHVRDLFAQAKQAAPAIIFIDEIDAIGRTRAGAGGITGGNDEREQTLDQNPDRNGRVRAERRGHRAGRHEQARDPRRCPAAPRPLRPQGGGAGPRPGRAAEDPSGPYALHAARS